MRTAQRRRLAAVGVLVAMVVVAVAAWLVGARVQSPAQAAARAAAPQASLVTVPVEFRILSSTEITRGDVVPAVATDVPGPAVIGTGRAGSNGGAAVVTAVFVQPGDEVNAGDRVVEVAGRPVFVFAGASPAYRALRPGMTGADVSPLQASQESGGCGAGDSGLYDDSTKTCVEQLYSEAGYEVVRGSDTEVADLAAAEAAVAEAEDALAAAQTALAAASRPAAPGEISQAELAVDAAQREYDAAVRAQPTLVVSAVDEVDDALAALNGLLAGSDPDAPSDGGGGQAGATGGDGGGTAGESTNADSTRSGVRGRNDARRALAAAVAGVDEAVQQGAERVAASEDELAAAQAALADATAEPDVSEQILAVDQAQAAVERAEQNRADLEAVSGAVVPYGEVVFVPELPARVTDVSALVGEEAGGDSDPSGTESLLTLASSSLQAIVSIPQASRDLVREGTSVELLDEITGEAVAGSVSSISERVEISPTSGQPGYPAVVAAELPEDWTGRNVRVTFIAASTEREVLVVPSAAVSSSADGQTRVQVQRANGTVETVAVSTGLSGDGFVEVAPIDAEALVAGDQVVVGE